MDENKIQTEEESQTDPKIELVLGRKIALAMIAIDWKYKEIAMKLVYK